MSDIGYLASKAGSIKKYTSTTTKTIDFSADTHIYCIILGVLTISTGRIWIPGTGYMNSSMSITETESLSLSSGNETNSWITATVNSDLKSGSVYYVIRNGATHTFWVFYK